MRVIVTAAMLTFGVLPAAMGQTEGSDQPWVGAGLYVPVRPCRVADTRAVGARLAAGESRLFRVLGPDSDLSSQGGSATGCGIPLEMGPFGVTAVVLNVVAVAPAGHGFVTLYSSNESKPSTSTLNYQASNFATANGIPVAVGCGPDPTCPNEPGFMVATNGSDTHLVADVVGYFASEIKASWGLWIRSEDPRFGIRVSAEQIGGTAIFGQATHHAGIGLWGSSVSGIGIAATSSQGIPLAILESEPGTLVDFRDDRGFSKGEISLAADGETVSYNAFTGSHYGWTDMVIEPGTLVSLNGTNLRRGDGASSEVIYGISPSAIVNDPSVLGAYAGRLNPSLVDAPSTDNPDLVHAVGNGQLWVVDSGSDLEPGDLLVSSAVPGHAMKLPPSLETAFVVARVAELVRWSDVAPDTQGQRRAKISVLFAPGVRTSTEPIRSELAGLRAENERLRLELVSMIAMLRRETDNDGEPTSAGLYAPGSSTTIAGSGH